ncbi:hypothetical protein [Kibdelosporangium philippinense]|uniref:hypothetical protein n=1 Tax=Kibdelosporangium philippinense TaxID=211113 RepID=UPI003612D219
MSEVDRLPGGDAVCCVEVLLEARENWLSIPDATLWKTGNARRLLPGSPMSTG